ncbi:MAG: VOC family protein [Deltaproteobacteria bacterium]|jgi:catechol 2,3-dioxygenase-like lactoylglutathione lyase family enzyme|nr:VOC family protein [Deltaproteobacteria bacterium]MBW2384084.1 VOC family protein [Deltaproteobacteria bacterium]MBW2695970.1 VOC family protein [Deltaproteobacteria bacterium]
MRDTDLRPSVWVGHILLTTDKLDASHKFMTLLGMRSISQGEGFVVLELRGGTHLVLLERKTITPAPASFDLMVEDLDATHARLEARGLAPSKIEEGEIHNSFTVQDPSGHTISFNSTHVSDQPV